MSNTQVLISLKPDQYPESAITAIKSRESTKLRECQRYILNVHIILFFTLNSLANL